MPRRIYCVIDFDERIGGGAQRFENRLGVYAEDYKIAELQERVSVTNGCPEILVYINYSPCGRCSFKLKQFTDSNKLIFFLVVAAFLNNISRLSSIKHWA